MTNEWRPHHREDLRASAISDEAMQARVYRSIGNAAVREVGFPEHKSGLVSSSHFGM